MRIKQIEISNVRFIGRERRTLTADDDKKVLILLGDNGSGKTTYLDSIAYTIAPFVAQFPGCSDWMLSDMDVHIQPDGAKADYLEVSSEFVCDNLTLHSTRLRKGIRKAPEGNTRELRDYALSLKDRIINKEPNINLPIFAYYGTGRGDIKAPERKRSFAQSFERWDCYKNAIAPSTDFKRFFQWYDLMEDEERRERERRWDREYQSPVLRAVREAIVQFMAPDYNNPRIKTRPLRFAIDKTDANGHTTELRMEQLSDGYKIVLAMVADIASRMTEANPDVDNPLEGTGIVLVDEIDLHLHPLWQRKILSQLTTTFPNIQFIVSTHSPIIVLGSIGFSQVIKIGEENSEYDSLMTSNIDDVLFGNLFNLPSVHAPIWDSRIQERDAILSKSELSNEDRIRLAQLDSDLSKITFTPSEYVKRNHLLLEQIIKMLGHNE